jgi:hypothetical protein
MKMGVYATTVTLTLSSPTFFLYTNFNKGVSVQGDEITQQNKNTEITLAVRPSLEQD